MTRYQFTIEYQARTGERWRTVYIADLDGARWVRREEIKRDDNWVEQTRGRVTAPTIEISTIGVGSTYAGP